MLKFLELLDIEYRLICRQQITKRKRVLFNLLEFTEDLSFAFPAIGQVNMKIYSIFFMSSSVDSEALRLVCVIFNFL